MYRKLSFNPQKREEMIKSHIERIVNKRLQTETDLEQTSKFAALPGFKTKAEIDADVTKENLKE